MSRYDLMHPSADDDEVRAALRIVGADWVDDLTDGMEAVFGEGGHQLDSMQSQMVALARRAIADLDRAWFGGCQVLSNNCRVEARTREPQAFARRSRRHPRTHYSEAGRCRGGSHAQRLQRLWSRSVFRLE